MTDENKSDAEFKLAVSDDQIIYEKSLSDVRKVEQIVGLAPRELEPINKSDDLDIKMLGFVLDNFQLVGVSNTSGFIERYPRYESLFIALPTEGTLEFITEQKHLKAGPMQALLISPTNSCKFNWGADSRIVLLHFRADLLQELVDDLPCNLGSQLLLFQDVINLESHKYSNLLKIMQAFSQEVKENPDMMREDSVIKPWLMIILTSLATIRSEKNTDSPQANFELAPYYVKRAVNYIHDNLNTEITRDHIVSASGVTQRSLHNSFKKNYGIGPMTYFRNVRLEHARDDLLKSTAQETNVNEVADKWGFHDHSRFAASYKKQFNELPSETLKRSSV